MVTNRYADGRLNSSDEMLANVMCADAMLADVYLVYDAGLQ